MQLPQCKNDMQKFIGKLNYLRGLIFNLSRKISAFVPILRLKKEAEFTWEANRQCAFDDIKRYLSSPPVMKAPMAGRNPVSAIHHCRGCRNWVCFEASDKWQGTHHYLLKLTPD
jgi:hypothetical protein